MQIRPAQDEPAPSKPRRTRRGWHRLRRIVILLILIPISLFLFFQIPSVQTAMADYLTGRVAETLDARVEIGRVQLTWLDELRLDDVFIEDKYGDTLLYGGSVEADLNLLAGLYVEHLTISNTVFKIRRDLGDPESNLATAISKLFPTDPNKEKNPLNIHLDALDLFDVAFIQNDSVKGQLFDAKLSAGVLRFREMDIPNKRIHLRNVELREPVVIQTNFSPTPLPEHLLLQDSLAQNAADTTRLHVIADNLEVINGRYSLDNFRKGPIQESDISAVDFARLGMFDIDIEMTELDFHEGEVTGALRHLGLEEKSGFVLDRLSVQDLKVSPTELQLYDLELVTAESRLSDTVRFQFQSWSDWLDFNNEVRMTVRIQESEVAVRDILYFARKLRFNPFFRDNRNSKVTIAGDFLGRVNNLRGRDIALALDQSTTLAGSFGSRNLARPGSESINLDLRSLRTNMRTVRRLLPNIKLPPNFDKLGAMAFSGRFDGFFTDFVATGGLQSQIGGATFNMALVSNENAPAEYGGALALTDFDLGAWSDNAQFGKVTFSGSVENGVGLEPSAASADLKAQITEFNFRDYAYRNALVDGRLEDRFFNGSFEIADDNIDLNFQGEVDFRDSIPTFDFDAAVGEVDLLALNLSKRPIGLRGDIDLNVIGTNLSELEGRVELVDFQVLIDTITVPVDSLVAFSNFNIAGEKVIELQSDLLTAQIVGRFDIEELTTSLTGYLIEYYPDWSQRLKIKPPRRIPAPNRFSFQLDVADSRGLNRLITPKLGPLVDLSLSGKYDGFSDELQVELIAPDVRFADVRLHDLVVKISGKQGQGEADLAVDSTFIDGRHLANRFTLLSLIDNEELKFGITYGGDKDNIFLDRINLDGSLSLPDEHNFELRFDRSNLELFQRAWTIADDNYIVFGPQYIDTENFSLRSGRRSITVNNQGEEGLNLNLVNMDLSLIDSLWDYQPLDFRGDVDIKVSVTDVFRQKGIRAEVRSDTFFMNDDDYGYLRIDLSADDPKSQVEAYMTLNQDTAQLIAEATYNLGDITATADTAGALARTQEKGYLDMDVNIIGYPLAVGSYWVGGSVSDIEGVFDANLKVQGPTRKLDVDGYIEARNGALTVDYLQTRYYFDHNRVAVNNSLFDLAGGTLSDRYGNVARLYGGVTHNRLKHLGLDASITTDRFLALDLQPGDNPTFFGRVFGDGLIRFTGDFRQPDIYVSATVGRDSRLSIPVNSASAAGPLDNVRFVNRSIYVEEEPTTATEPTGVSLSMDITVTEEAVGEIIFDEEVGDILRGSGNGNLQLNIPRDGELRMYGDYNITGGSYLFTFQRVVNKEFSVRPGGRVTWTGDPFEARLDIEADYENLRTPILPFIQEYLITSVNPDVENNAARATEVDLTLKLNGLLTKPDINFDLSFPNLDPLLETYANNKRQLLLLDQNELNRQVFGLIVAGQFLPSDLSFGISDAAINTVSEWLSNYFSLLVNDLVRNTFGEEAFISKLDFDFAYNSYRNSTLDAATDGRSSALEFSVSRDFNNRLRISNDLNVFNNNQLGGLQSTGTFVGNDLAIEYVLNDDRTLRLRFYERLEPDFVSNRRLQVGTGLSWRKEFDTFGEFLRGFRKDVKKQEGR